MQENEFPFIGSLLCDIYKKYFDIKKMSENIKKKTETNVTDSEQDNNSREEPSDDELTKYNSEMKNWELIIEKFRTDCRLTKYNLNKEEIIIVALVWGTYLGNSNINTANLLELISPDTMFEVSHLGRIISLLDREILVVDNFTWDYHTDCKSLLSEDLFLDKELELILFGVNFYEKINEILSEECSSDIEFIYKIVKSTNYTIAGYLERAANCQMISVYRYYYKQISQSLKPIIDFIDSSDQQFSLCRYFREYNLDNLEKILVLILLTEKFCREENVSYRKMNVCISKDYNDSMKNLKYFSPESKLMNNYLIEMQEDMFSSEQFYSLSKKTLRFLQVDSTQKFKLSDNSNLRLITTEQTIDQLILPQETLEIITTAVKKYTQPDQFSFASWGLLTPSLGTDKKEQNISGNGLLLLFYGVSGTGKTLAAGAIANELKKNLIIIEAARIRSPWYGKTEQNIKDLFQTMRKLISCENNNSVFLLNEADQLIHQRNESMSGSGRAENSIQNIILEELETFPGIFIATTNLINNLDNAFFRRFHYKIEFCVPDYLCRKKIWSCHLPSTIPGADDIDIDFLAKKYPLTGGQIRIIVENACSTAIIREGNRKRLFLDDLIRFTSMESLHSITGNKAIGFAS